uniref:Uncharacterized protein n=1 Tax=Cannabis sativa TaxID=3483 RepID=A0A803NLS3_CANSA
MNGWKGIDTLHRRMGIDTMTSSEGEWLIQLRVVQRVGLAPFGISTFVRLTTRNFPIFTHLLDFDFRSMPGMNKMIVIDIIDFRCLNLDGSSFGLAPTHPLDVCPRKTMGPTRVSPPC